MQTRFVEAFSRVVVCKRFPVEPEKRALVQNALEGAKFLLGESSSVVKSIRYDEPTGVLTFNRISKFNSDGIPSGLLANRQPEKTFGPCLPEPNIASFRVKMPEVSPLKGAVFLFSLLQDIWGFPEYQCLVEELNPILKLKKVRYQAIFTNSNVSLKVTTSPLAVEQDNNEPGRYRSYRASIYQGPRIQEGIPEFQTTNIEMVMDLVREDDRNSLAGHQILQAGIETYATKLPESVLQSMTVRREWRRPPSPTIYHFKPSTNGYLVFDIPENLPAHVAIAAALGIQADEAMAVGTYQ